MTGSATVVLLGTVADQPEILTTKAGKPWVKLVLEIKTYRRVNDGAGYVLEKAEITDSAPRHSAGAFFMSALAGRYRKPVSTVTPKADRRRQSPYAAPERPPLTDAELLHQRALFARCIRFRRSEVRKALEERGYVEEVD